MAEFADMTEERFAEIARTFGVSLEEVKAQWEIAQAQGADSVLAEMDSNLAQVEADLEEVVEVAASHLSHQHRYRGMGNFYEECIDALSHSDADATSVTDLLLKLAVALFKLAEAQQRIAELSDGNYRPGTP